MPEVAPALVEILFLALVFFTIALAFSAQKISQALLGGIISALEAIPLIGGKLAGPFRAVDQAVSNACGLIVAKCEALVGASFHVLARFTDWLWRQTVGEAAALAHLGRLIGDHVYSLSGLRGLVHRLEKVWHGIEHGVRTLTKEYHGLERRVHAIEREIGAGIGNDVRTSVHDLLKWEKAAKAQLKADEKAITTTLPGELTALENFIKAIPGTRYLDWAAGIVTAALGLEIWDLLRCPSLLNSAKRRGCGLWNGLEDLLGLFIDAVLLTHLCDLPKWIEELFSPLLGELTGLISSAANSLCAAANPKWAKLEVQNGPLPPPQTLYLPDHFG